MDAVLKKKIWFIIALGAAHTLLLIGVLLGVLAGYTIRHRPNADLQTTLVIAIATCFWFYWLITNSLRNRVNSGEWLVGSKSDLPPAN